MDNVNNLNGIPNFGHGMPEDGVVIAGVTAMPQEIVEEEAPAEVEPEEEAPQEVEVTNQEEN